MRALAFKGIRILYRCWQSRAPYDESLYLKALQRRSSNLVPRDSARLNDSGRERDIHAVSELQLFVPASGRLRMSFMNCHGVSPALSILRRPPCRAPPQTRLFHSSRPLDEDRPGRRYRSVARKAPGSTISTEFRHLILLHCETRATGLHLRAGRKYVRLLLVRLTESKEIARLLRTGRINVS